jgi:hypothetical protein
MYQEMLRLEQCHNLVDDSPNEEIYSTGVRYCEDHGWSKLEQVKTEKNFGNNTCSIKD